MESGANGGGVTEVLLAVVVGWLKAWSMMRLAALTSNMGMGPKPAGGTEPPQWPLLPLLLLVRVEVVVVAVLVAADDGAVPPLLSWDLAFQSPLAFWRPPTVGGFFTVWHPFGKRKHP